MPIFEYKCLKCDFVSKFLEKPDADDKIHKCEKCGSKKVEKIHSVFSPKISNSTCSTGNCPLS